MHQVTKEGAAEVSDHIRRHTALLHAAAGALAGCFARFIVGPLDVVKIRFQVQLEPIGSRHASKYTGIRQALALIVKEEGILVCPRTAGTSAARRTWHIVSLACRVFGKGPSLHSFSQFHTQQYSSWHTSNAKSWLPPQDLQVHLVHCLFTRLST
jgi:Mitochondrial carrier protein